MVSASCDVDTVCTRYLWRRVLQVASRYYDVRISVACVHMVRCRRCFALFFKWWSDAVRVTPHAPASKYRIRLSPYQHHVTTTLTVWIDGIRAFFLSASPWHFPGYTTYATRADGDEEEREPVRAFSSVLANSELGERAEVLCPSPPSLIFPYSPLSLAFPPVFPSLRSRLLKSR